MNRTYFRQSVHSHPECWLSFLADVDPDSLWFFVHLSSLELISSVRQKATSDEGQMPWSRRSVTRHASGVLAAAWRTEENYQNQTEEGTLFLRCCSRFIVHRHSTCGRALTLDQGSRLLCLHNTGCTSRDSSPLLTTTSSHVDVFVSDHSKGTSTKADVA